MGNRIRRRTKKKAAAIAIIVILAILLIAFAVIALTGNLPVVMDAISELFGEEKRTALPVDGKLQIHFIDVGQADCILVISDAKVMLIDTGDTDKDYIDKTINYIKNLGVSTIDYLILTHPDADHIGGAPDIINAFNVSKCIMPDYVKTTKIFTNTLTALAQTGVEVVPFLSNNELPIDKSITPMMPGNTFTVGQAQCKLLAPLDSYDDANEVSIVIRLDFGENSVLLTGDAEKESEADIVKQYPASELQVDVLKSGHHGSSTSSSAALLDMAKPTYAVISCGEGNKYGHPHTETIERYQRYGIETYRTDKNGTIVMNSDGKTITFTMERQ